MKSDTDAIGIWSISATVLTLIVLGTTACLLIFKSDRIIQILKLDQGFDQEVIILNMHRSTIFGISIIVLGGVIIANEIPNLCRLLFDYYQEKRMTHGQTSPQISYSVMSASRILVGLLLLLNRREIVKFIEWKGRKKTA